MRINQSNPCRYHTTIYPLAKDDHIRRIRKLDVRLTMLDDSAEEGSNQYFKDALDSFGFFGFPLLILESLSFHVEHELDADTHLELPKELFYWGFLPPIELRHLALHGCYGGPIRAVRNLTSFELTGVQDIFDPIELDQRTFLPFISGSPSLVSLRLSHCGFPGRAQLSRVTPVKLHKLKSLQLTDVYGLPGFPGLIEVPAFEKLSSLRISARKWGPNAVDLYNNAHFLVRAEGGGGFQLFHKTLDYHELTSDWLGVTHDADPNLTFVRLEGELDLTEENELGASPLPLFTNAKILEIGASFANLWYHDFWKDLEKVGPQLTTLRLEVVEGMKPAVAMSVKELVKARFQKDTPLTKLERMTFEEMSREDEEKAKKLWEEFRASLNIDQYLAVQ